MYQVGYWSQTETYADAVDYNISMHELAVEATFDLLYCGCVEMAHYIINEKWYSERHDNSEQEAILIVKAAARIIREEVRATTFTKETYLAVEDISDKEKGLEFLTLCLRTFVEKTAPSCVIK